jgi:hypothetical protein
MTFVEKRAAFGFNICTTPEATRAILASANSAQRIKQRANVLLAMLLEPFSSSALLLSAPP